MEVKKGERFVTKDGEVLIASWDMKIEGHNFWTATDLNGIEVIINVGEVVRVIYRDKYPEEYI